MRNAVKNFFLFVIAFLIIAAVLSMVSGEMGLPFEAKPTEVDVGRVMSQIAAGEVSRVLIEQDMMTITLSNGSEEIARKESQQSFSELAFHYGIPASALSSLEVEVKGRSGMQAFLGALLPFLFPFLIIGVFVWIMMRQVQGANQRAMSFGQSNVRQSKADDGKEKVTFKDVAGAKEAKVELEEVVDFLRSPKKYSDVGAKIPKGVLLVGSPGVGKTLLARAVSGEAQVPFFHISGSEFVEMFVGVGASRVRDLFRKAKKAAPCIIFIDELDAVGRKRGAGLGGSHDEREQTLNQILVEMDGFETNIGIVVMAATNRPDVLDSALLRPGRFDRRVVIDMPDINDREEILKVHARGKPFSPDVNLRKIAERTPGFSGADLANLLNEAAILAARNNKTIIESAHILESTERVMLGPERKSHILSEKEKKITAYHEAGHALVAHALPHADPVHKISIISRGQAAGYTLKLPTEDKHMHAKAEFIDDLAVLLAGYATEKEIFGDVTTGAYSDLKKATDLARRMVTEYGMSEKLGPRTFGEKEELIFLGREIHEQRDYSEDTAKSIDAEVSRFIKRAYMTAVKTIKQWRPKMEDIVRVLMEKETIEREEFEELMGAKMGAAV